MLTKKLRTMARRASRRPSPHRHTAIRRPLLETLETRAVRDGSGTLELLDLSDLTIVPRIVNGTTTTAFTSVGIVGDTGGGFCSGTLISPTHVLTAGHCAAGVGNTSGRFTVGGQTYSTNRVISHPQYNDATLANDIAIFQLSQPVANITPSPINRTTPTVGQLLTLVGFGGGGNGTTGHTGDFGTKRVGTTPIDGVAPTLISWRFDNNNESNTAPGDSGGPAFLQINGNYVVAGVTSGGDRADAGIGDNSFDTRVDAFASWIDSITNQTAPPPSNPPTTPPASDDHANSPGATATVLALSAAGIGRATGVLEANGDRDVFQIRVAATGTATISVSGASGLDSYLRVYDSAGRLVAENDDDGGTLNSRVTMTVTAGTYYLSVGAYGDQGTGAFQLDAQVAAQPTGTPFDNATKITLDTRGQGRADSRVGSAGATQYFAFNTTLAGRVTVATTATSGNLDTVLTLYDARGNQVAMNDDYRGLNSRLQYNVNAGETYYAKVSGWSGTTGNFRLNVSTQASRLAAREWTNPADRFDVNGDSNHSPVDVLMIVNYLNSAAVSRSTVAAGQTPTGYFDVNADGSITPMDALTLVNHLNDPSADASSPASSMTADVGEVGDEAWTGVIDQETADDEPLITDPLDDSVCQWHFEEFWKPKLPDDSSDAAWESADPFGDEELDLFAWDDSETDAVYADAEDWWDLA